MKNGISAVRRAACSIALFSASFCVLSQTSTENQNASLPEVIVSATRIAQPLAQAIADVTVIDRAEIERSGAAALGDVLARLPGFEINRNGGPASTTGVFLRGAETRFTSVYVDGVRIDSQSTGGAAWQAIPLSQIDRLEVVRGAVGAVYGSDAISGAIQIFTRQGQAGVHPYVGVGIGTYGTYKIEAGVSGADASWNYAVGIARDSSDGFNATTSTSANPDKDGFTAESASARLGFKVNAEHRLDASFMSNQQRGQYDGCTSVDDGCTPGVDDVALQKLQTASLRWQAQWTAQYRSTVSVGTSQDRYETTPSVYLTDTNLKTFYWQNEYRLGASLFSAALERRDDSLSNARTTPSDTSHFQNALALGYNWVEGAQSLQLNVRRDEDSAFGGQNTGSAGYGFAFASQWRATASFGTAFRAPTLFQRYSDYGSAILQPETSQNLEASLRYAGDMGELGLTVYRNDVSNLIIYDGSVSAGTCAGADGSDWGGCYANVAKARYEGVTITASRDFGFMNARASLDFQNPRDLDSGKLLARRARQHGILALETAWNGWLLGSELQLSSMRYDDAANKKELADYALLNMYAQTKIAKDLSVLLRLDNAGDVSYVLAGGYATAGRSWYAGLKWAM
jgi:vitamin B12 transporter